DEKTGDDVGDKVLRSKADSQAKDAGSRQDGPRLDFEHPEHEHSRTEIDEILANGVKQRHQRLALLVQAALFVVQAERLVQEHLQQLDYDPAAEDDANALDNRGPQGGNRVNEIKLRDTHRGGPDINHRFKTAFPERK